MAGKSVTYSNKENSHEKITNIISAALSAVIVVIVLFSLFDFFFRNFGLPPLLARGWNDVLMLFGFILVLLSYKHKGLAAYDRTESDLPYIALMVFACVTVVVNRIPVIVAIDGLRVLGQVVFWYVIIYYGLKKLKDRKFFEELISYMLIAAAIVALYGVVQYVFAFETPANWIDRDMENIRTRVFSTIGNPNALGGYMVMFIPIALSLGFARNVTNKSRAWYLVISIVMALTLIFTFSRGAWIGFAAGVGLLMVLKDKRFIVLFLIFMILMPILLPDTITSRLFHAFSPEYIERSAEAGRLFYWRQAFVRMVNNPIFGTGVGSFGDSVAVRHSMPGAVWVDNHYLKTGAELGVVGLGLFLWLIASVFIRSYKNLKILPNGFPKEFNRGVIAGLFAVLVQNGTASIFEVLVVGTYFWVLVGMLFAMPHIYQKDERSNGGDTV